MAVMKLLKEIKNGQGDKYVKCSECGMLALFSDTGLGEDEELTSFTCAKCLRVIELEKLLLEEKNKESNNPEIKGLNFVDRSTDSKDLGGKTNLKIEKVKSVNYEMKGVVLGDSLVRHVGSEVSKVFPRVAKCCLPGARVKDVLDAVNRGAVQENDKVVLWAGTNDVCHSTNQKFREDLVELVDKTKELSQDISVMSLLPRYGLKYGWENQRVKVLNDLIQKVCIDKGITFVNVWGECQRDWIGWDGVHLSRKGNQAVGNLMMINMESKN